MERIDSAINNSSAGTIQDSSGSLKNESYKDATEAETGQPQHTRTLFRLWMDAKTSFPWPSTETKVSTADWASSPRVAKALERLPLAEQEAVRRFFRPSDASLKLAAYILKHSSISRACKIPWSECVISQERHINNGKPYFQKGGVEFNVSHHGSIVALVATTIPEVHVGVDVVQVDSARDRRGLDKEGGFEGWVGMFKDIFSEREFRALLNIKPLASGQHSEETLRMKLRRFHANWALKEAYIKMTGDALMAQWLRQLEFTSTTPPPPHYRWSTSGWEWGETTVTGVTLHEKPVEGVRVEIDALSEDYMVATAINHPETLPRFEQVTLSPDASTLDCKHPDSGHVTSYSLDS